MDQRCRTGKRSSRRSLRVPPGAMNFEFIGA
jgi:hypothetical protein